MIPASTWCMIIVINLQLKRVMTSQSDDVIAIMNPWCCMSNIVKLMISQPVVVRLASGLNFSNPEIKIFIRMPIYFCPKVNRSAAILKYDFFLLNSAFSRQNLYLNFYLSDFLPVCFFVSLL